MIKQNLIYVVFRTSYTATTMSYKKNKECSLVDISLMKQDMEIMKL